MSGSGLKWPWLRILSRNFVFSFNVYPRLTCVFRFLTLQWSSDLLPLLSAASYADNSFYWPLLIINESSKNSICFIAGQQVFKGRRQQLNCAAAIILLRMQFYIFPRRCLQLNWGNGTLFIFTASPLRSRLASLLPVSQVVLQTSHRLHNRFSQSRRRPLLGPSPGCTNAQKAQMLRCNDIFSVTLVCCCSRCSA